MITGRMNAQVITVEIVEKEYLPEQQILVDIFRQHAESIMPDFPVIFKMPSIPNKVRKQINHIPCRNVGKMDAYELVSMEVINFVRLMVKSGIEVQVYDKEVNDDIH